MERETRCAQMPRVATMGKLLLCILFINLLVSLSCQAENPSPKPWPQKFHSRLYDNGPGSMSLVDLWYDWPNGRNLNIIQYQLSYKLYSLEWNNGTSHYYDLEAKTCNTLTFPVGILRPDWLDHSQYIGTREMDGFTCHVWEKADFITYYEDVATQRPVAWYFHSIDHVVHVFTFEIGASLPDESWEAPSYCFTGSEVTKKPSTVLLRRDGLDNLSWSDRWGRRLSDISRKVV